MEFLLAGLFAFSAAVHGDDVFICGKDADDVTFLQVGFWTQEDYRCLSLHTLRPILNDIDSYPDLALCWGKGELFVQWCHRTPIIENGRFDGLDEDVKRLQLWGE